MELTPDEVERLIKDVAPAQRDAPRTIPCVCLMIHTDPWGNVIRDKCGADTTPDRPVCDHCERAGHPDSPEFRGVIHG